MARLLCIVALVFLLFRLSVPRAYHSTHPQAIASLDKPESFYSFIISFIAYSDVSQ